MVKKLKIKNDALHIKCIIDNTLESSLVFDPVFLHDGVVNIMIELYYCGTFYISDKTQLQHAKLC